MSTLDPKKVIITIGGVIPTGFADGTFVTITPDGDDFATYKGSDGVTSRAAQNNTTAIMVLKLQQTSPANAALSALRAVDVTTGVGAFPVGVKDLLGSTTHAAAKCWFVKQPESKFGKEIDVVEWNVQLTVYKGFIGGNIL